jgi:hypothetical protein
LRLAPQDRRLQADLAAARDQVLYGDGSLGRPPPGSRPPWLPALPAPWSLIGAVACYALGWVGLTRWRMVRRSGWLGLAGGAGMMAAALALLVIDAGRRPERDRAQPLVVIAADNVLLRKGDNLAFPPRFETPLRQGVEARLRFSRGDWLQIELAGGEIGWVPRRLTYVDEP